MIRTGSNATMAMMQARPERVAGGRPRIEKIKLKVVQQVANETDDFVPKYGQDTRPQAPDGRMKLGKKPRNIGLDLTDSPITKFVHVTILVR